MTLEMVRAYRKRYSDSKTEAAMLYEILEGKHGNELFNSKLFNTCSYMLMQLSHLPSVTLKARCYLLEQGSRLFWKYDFYKQALACLRRYFKECPASFQHPAVRLRLVYCLVLLRRPRNFYRVVKQLCEHEPKSTQ